MLVIHTFSIVKISDFIISKRVNIVTVNFQIHLSCNVFSDLAVYNPADRQAEDQHKGIRPEGVDVLAALSVYKICLMPWSPRRRHFPTERIKKLSFLMKESA